jgi:hypothetical protein
MNVYSGGAFIAISFDPSLHDAWTNDFTTRSSVRSNGEQAAAPMTRTSVEPLIDDRNRTASEMRAAFIQSGWGLGGNQQRQLMF